MPDFELAVISKGRSGLMIRYRQEHGLSQKAAAQEADVSVSAWLRMEGLKFKSISREVVEKVADLLCCSIDSLFPPALRGENWDFSSQTFRRYDVAMLEASSAQAQRLTLPSPEDAAIQKERHEELREKMKKLSYREEIILKLRFGLEGERSHTLSEVSKIFKLTRERVRQIEGRGIRRLQADRSWERDDLNDNARIRRTLYPAPPASTVEADPQTDPSGAPA
jgi:RNA polymerase sigma factor (sigma-70 family)